MFVLKYVQKHNDIAQCDRNNNLPGPLLLKAWMVENVFLNISLCTYLFKQRERTPTVNG